MVAISPPLDVEDLPWVFPIIEPYITSIADRYSGLSACEVHRVLSNGAATLHLVEGEGFFVAEWLPGDCHILVAHAYDSHTAAGFPAVILAAADYAASLGCTSMSLASPRPGYRRVLPPLGFTSTGDIYSKELTRV